MGVMLENLAKGRILKKLDDRYSNSGLRDQSRNKLEDAIKAWKGQISWDDAKHSLASIGADHSSTTAVGSERILAKRDRKNHEFGKNAQTLQKAKNLGVVVVEGGQEKVVEKQHLLKHWFSQDVREGWWPNHPDHPVEEVLTNALFQALDVAKKRNLDTVDSYWVCAGQNHPFEAFVCWNTKQVTLIILTPSVPHEHKETFVDDPQKVEQTKANQSKGLLAVRRHKETKEVIVRPVRLRDGGAGPIGTDTSDD